LGHQQRLGRDAARLERLLHALVIDALVGGMHIDDHQSFGILGEDVDTLELRDGIAKGWDIHRVASIASGCKGAALMKIAVVRQGGSHPPPIRHPRPTTTPRPPRQPPQGSLYRNGDWGGTFNAVVSIAVISQALIAQAPRANI